jgi:hypothetical protein
MTMATRAWQVVAGALWSTVRVVAAALIPHDSPIRLRAAAYRPVSRWLAGYPAYRRAMNEARWSGHVPTVVIVGNAPLGYDYSGLVDAADVVVRLNDCKRYLGRSGTKTTILCVNNSGVPARGYIAQTPLLTNPLCGGVGEFWFPRDMHTHLRWVRRVRHDRDHEYQDLTDGIVAANRLFTKTLVRGSAAMNDALYTTLQTIERANGVPDRSFECPSTGALAMAWALADPRFREHRVVLVGFRFEGWEGHPWRAERQWVDEHVRSGRVVLHPA